MANRREPAIGPLKSKSQLQHRNEHKHMTQNVNTPADDDLFEDAKETFPGKPDLKDRLVVVYPTGVTGWRKSDIPGNKDYEWFESTTVVLDDGPTGETYTDLVPSVAANGPQVLTGFQWTGSGFEARLRPLAADTTKVRSMLGRINSRPNKIKGMSDSWSIAAPTEAEKATARKHTAVCAAARQAVAANRAKVQDEAAF